MDNKVGVLGGGQLGRMMMEAAQRLGIKLVILDEGNDGPAKQLSNSTTHIDGSFRDSEKIVELSAKVDVLTVEIEHIDVTTLHDLEAKKPGFVHPSPKTLKTIQDKFQQKVHLSKRGVPLPEYREISDISNLKEIASQWGFPLMLKAKTLAYDGRGNFVLKRIEDIDNLSQLVDLPLEQLYVERWVNYTKELACMVVRSASGRVVSYPIVETIQKDNVCHVVLVPTSLSSSASTRAKIVAELAVQSFEGAGIFGVEMFLLEDGEILVNEIAPRPHNSGHYTIEACHTSQFENHLRAVADLPLGSCALKVPCAAMINILGCSSNMQEIKSTLQETLSVSGATIHWYGKQANRKGRKMGHVTVVAEDQQQLKDRVQAILKALPGNLADEAPSYLNPSPEVGVIMGSDSDLPVMKAAAAILEEFNVPFELTIVSAHRTPERMVQYAHHAHERGIKVIIAAAGGAAHLPGMVASMTPLPVIGVPIAGKHLDGADSLHSIVQMPRGVPVATVAINNSTNAALLAIRILGSFNPIYLEKMKKYQQHMEAQVLEKVTKLDCVGWKDY